MARKSLVATVVGIAAFAVPNAFADKGGIPHEGSNGQGRPATQQQAPAPAPRGKALAKGHAKTHAKAHAKTHAKTQTHVTPQGHALAKGHAKSHTTQQAPPATNTHAKAGKTTICHATGSKTNPYVTITISNNAIPAHKRHQDGRDIIPAPAGGCSTAAAGAQQPAQEQAAQQQSAQHQQSGQQQQSAQQPAASTAQGEVLGETTSGSSGSPTSATAPGQVRVLGATTSGRAPSASSAPAALATRTSGSSGLPFTGTDAIIVAILGLAAVLLGVTVRRATTTRV